MSHPPSLNGQVIGQAEHATRAVLDRLLAGAGVDFHDWVALNLTATADAPLGRTRLADRMAGALKIDDGIALATIDGLTDAGLLTVGAGTVALTDAGRARYADIRAALDEVTARLYGDLPAADLSTAGRVLATVTARANAELTRAA
ncbi:hypothetical protein ACFOX0_22010 [Micromonospora zhanjiangensis]|uniref:Winged helix DNA-binding domain-containing protein n=1 Tax=Micromonospora zhanjiangensis TaxID=1522057 RepID=A0ABV8KR17_9ACTN